MRPVNWDRMNLKPFEKNFYNATSASRNADPREVERFRLVTCISTPVFMMILIFPIDNQ